MTGPYLPAGTAASGAYELEVTPESVRIRKVVLDQNDRATMASRARKANA